MTVNLTSLLFVLIINFIVFLLSFGETQKLSSVCRGFIYLPDDCSGCIWSVVFNKILFHSPLLTSPFLCQLNKTLYIAVTNSYISRSLVTACIRFRNSSHEAGGYISPLGMFVKCLHWPFALLGMWLIT